MPVQQSRKAEYRIGKRSMRIALEQLRLALEDPERILVVIIKLFAFKQEIELSCEHRDVIRHHVHCSGKIPALDILQAQEDRWNLPHELAAQIAIPHDCKPLEQALLPFGAAGVFEVKLQEFHEHGHGQCLAKAPRTREEHGVAAGVDQDLAQEHGLVHIQFIAFNESGKELFSVSCPFSLLHLRPPHALDCPFWRQGIMILQFEFRK